MIITFTEKVKYNKFYHVLKEEKNGLEECGSQLKKKKKEEEEEEEDAWREKVWQDISSTPLPKQQSSTLVPTFQFTTGAWKDDSVCK